MVTLSDADVTTLPPASSIDTWTKGEITTLGPALVGWTVKPSLVGAPTEIVNVALVARVSAPDVALSV